MATACYHLISLGCPALLLLGHQGTLLVLRLTSVPWPLLGTVHWISRQAPHAPRGSLVASALPAPMAVVFQEGQRSSRAAP